MTVRAFVFDMDGTLVDSMGFHAQAWVELLAELDVEMATDEARRRTGGQSNEQILQEILGDGFPEKDLADLAARKEILFRSLCAPHLQALAGLGDFLARAQTLAVPMAVATSAGQDNIDFVLGGLELSGYFQAVVGAEDVANGKPDPEMFLTAAARLGVPPDQCLVFEDSLAGLEAAGRAGMKAVAVTTTLDTQVFTGLPVVVGVIKDYVALDPEEVRQWTTPG